MSWRGRLDNSTMATTAAGVLSLFLGAEAVVVLLLAFAMDRPIGMGILLKRDQIEVPMRTDGGQGFKVEIRERTVPSGLMMVALCAGATLGGTSIYLAQRSEPARGARVAKVGLASCVVAVLLAWSMIMATTMLGPG